MSNLSVNSQILFEDIKHVDEGGVEFWYARELQVVLEYTQWRRFKETIDRAKVSCENAGFLISDHFADVGKMVGIGSGAERNIEDYMLSRYACYLIAQNGDPRKKVIAAAQSYFAIQTRRQDLQDNFEQLSEDQRRLAIRQELKGHNASLAEAAKLKSRKIMLFFKNLCIFY